MLSSSSSPSPSFNPRFPSSSLLRERLYTRSSSNRIRRSSRSIAPTNISLGAPITRALTLLTRTSAGIASTLASRLLCTLDWLHCLLIVRLAPTFAALTSLQVRQTSSLGVDITDLLIGLRVERH